MMCATVVRTLVLTAALAAALTPVTCLGEDGNQLPTRATKELPPELLSLLRQKKMPKHSPILVRIFKEETELEVWKQDTTGQRGRGARLHDLPGPAPRQTARHESDRAPQRRRSSGAPTSSTSFPTRTPSSVSWVPSCSNRTMNGPSNGHFIAVTRHQLHYFQGHDLIFCQYRTSWN